MQLREGARHQGQESGSEGRRWGFPRRGRRGLRASGSGTDGSAGTSQELQYKHCQPKGEVKPRGAVSDGQGLRKEVCTWSADLGIKTLRPHSPTPRDRKEAAGRGSRAPRH